MIIKKKVPPKPKTKKSSKAKKAFIRRSKKKSSNRILERVISVKDYLSTGSVLLDLAISCSKHRIGGIPNNRIIEFSGGTASSKTYICGEIAGSALRKDYEVVIDDIERRWDLTRLDTFDIDGDNKNFVYLNPPSRSLEECFDRLYSYLDKAKANGTDILYIIDPIAALYSMVEKEASDKMGQSRAKALQKNFRYLKDYMNEDNGGSVTIVFSNQIIDNVGVTFGPKTRTPGGNALKHWPSVKIKNVSGGKLDKETSFKGKKLRKVNGIKVIAKIDKNSEDDAHRQIEYTIVNGYGIDNITDCINWLEIHTNALDAGKKKFAFRKFDGGKKGLISYIEKNDLEKKLFNLTRECFREYYKPDVRKPKERG